jgi:predicted transcriptional regulator
MSEERMRFVDVLHSELLKTYEQVKEPGKSALVIFIEEYAHGLSIAPSTLRRALVILDEEKRISARKMRYPSHIPEAWEIVFLEGGQS